MLLLNRPTGVLHRIHAPVNISAVDYCSTLCRFHTNLHGGNLSAFLSEKVGYRRCVVLCCVEPHPSQVRCTAPLHAWPACRCDVLTPSGPAGAFRWSQYKCYTQTCQFIRPLTGQHKTRCTDHLRTTCTIWCSCCNSITTHKACAQALMRTKPISGNSCTAVHVLILVCRNRKFQHEV